MQGKMAAHFSRQDYSGLMAPMGQADSQVPQSRHKAGSTLATVPFMLTASLGQASMQARQAVQKSSSTLYDIHTLG
jgi:hypothetical protein